MEKNVGYPIVVGDFISTGHSNADNLEGLSGWQPPLGKKGKQGRWLYDNRFKGNEGRFDIRHPSKQIVICGLLGLIPEDFIKSKGPVSDYRAVHGGYAANASMYYRMYNRPFDDQSLVLNFNYTKDESIRRLSFPYVWRKPVKEDLMCISFTADTSPGAIASGFMSKNPKAYTPLSGGRFLKGSFIATAVRAVSEDWDMIHKGGRNNQAGFFSVGFREKHSILSFKELGSKGTKILETRPVCVPDLYNICFDSVYFQAFMAYGSDDMRGVSEIGQGHSMGNLGGTKLIEDDASFCGFIEADWSKFDVHVPIRLIEVAFSIVRACFPPGDEVDNAFIFMMNNFIYKNVFTPDGQVYSIKGGVPSGSVGTSIIGGLVNWLAMSDILEHCPVFSKKTNFRYKLDIAGDDTRIRCTDSISHAEWVSVRQYAERKFGMILDNDFVINHEGESNPNKCASFLKTVIVDSVPSRKMSDLWTKLVVGSILKSIVKEDFEYLLSRLTNVFLAERPKRRAVAALMAFISISGLGSEDDCDRALREAIRIAISGSNEGHLEEFALSSRLIDMKAFKSKTDTYDEFLEAWYDRLNFSIKTRKDLNYGEIGKLRYTVDAGSCFKQYQFSGDYKEYSSSLFHFSRGPTSLGHPP